VPGNGPGAGVRLEDAPEQRAAAAAFRLTRVIGREFAGRSPLALDRDLRVYLGDLTRPFGLPLREDLLDEGAGHAYAEMAEELIGAAVGPDEPVDLLVLAFAVPDVQPGRFTALHLGHVCPGDPLAFAICDQGAAAAFTALRIAHEYTRSSQLRRALVLIVEQAALHYPPMIEPGDPPALPVRHTGVALLCDGSSLNASGGNDTGTDGSAATAEIAQIREHAAVAPESVRPLLATEVAALLAGSPDGVLVLGDGITPADAADCVADRVIRAPADLPRTGVWLELARQLPHWMSLRTSLRTPQQQMPRPSPDPAVAVLADYDRQLRMLCLCSFEL
jgi:hypothetical protein